MDQERQRDDLRYYLWLLCEWNCILWKYPERAHSYKRGEPERSEIRRSSWLKRRPVKQHPASHVQVQRAVGFDTLSFFGLTLCSKASTLTLSTTESDNS
jgi:hypothetical protein